jgi:hypothetical protein
MEYALVRLTSDLTRLAALNLGKTNCRPAYPCGTGETGGTGRTGRTGRAGRAGRTGSSCGTRRSLFPFFAPGSLTLAAGGKHKPEQKQRPMHENLRFGFPEPSACIYHLPRVRFAIWGLKVRRKSEGFPALSHRGR